MKMKSALWDKIGHMSVVEMDVPEPKRNEVKIKIAYCGICDNDPQIINGDIQSFSHP